jgi:hypothetical protein
MIWANCTGILSENTSLFMPILFHEKFCSNRVPHSPQINQTVTIITDHTGRAFLEWPNTGVLGSNPTWSMDHLRVLCCFLSVKALQWVDSPPRNRTKYKMATCFRINFGPKQAMARRMRNGGISRWLPTAAARVRARVWSCGICGGQSGAGAGFLWVLRFPLPIFIPPSAPQSPSSIIWGLYNRPEVAAVPSGLSPTPLIISGVIAPLFLATALDVLRGKSSQYPRSGLDALVSVKNRTPPSSP